jgi:hypothetical protein
MALTARQVLGGNPYSDSYQPNKKDLVALLDGYGGAIAGEAATRAAQIAGLQTDIQGAAVGLRRYATYAALAADPGTVNGQPGEVTEDGGTHTDPVVGGTVANKGKYRWSASPAGWQWVGLDDVSSVLQAAVQSGLNGTYILSGSAYDATAINDVNGQFVGFSLSAGQNGVDGSNNSFLLAFDAVAVSPLLSGAVMRTSARFDLTDWTSVSLIPFMFVERNGVVQGLEIVTTITNTGQFRVITNTTIGTEKTVVLEWWSDGTETGAGVQLVLSGGSATGTQTVTFNGKMSTRLYSSVASLFSTYDQTLALALSSTRQSAVLEAVRQAIEGVAYRSEVTLAPSGGDYATVQTANAGSGSGSPVAPRAVRMEPGVYQNLALVTGEVWRSYLDWLGDSRDRVMIEHINPADVAVSKTVDDQPILSWFTATYRNFSARTKNARYVIHSDNSGTRVDQKLTYQDLHLEHLGNQEAIDYQTGLGGSGDPSGVWSQNNSRAIGIGTSSGTEFLIERCVLKAPRSVLGIHDNRDFDKPNRIVVKDCDLICTDGTTPARAAVLGAFGSGQPSTIEMVGNRSNGELLFYAIPWLSAAADNQPADPFGQLILTGHSNSPMVSTILVNSTPQRALKIESASTGSGTSIAISGDSAAIEALFGTVFTQDGGGGLAGFAWGYNNIASMNVGPSSDQAITALGRRLGNRSGTPWTLLVSVNGGADITVTFNQNHTLQSNATVLGIVNAALGSAATASEYFIASRHRARFADEEADRLNTSVAGIPAWSWTAFDLSDLKVRLATSADDPARLAGVAYSNDIPIGKTGRVKHSGYFGLNDLLINGSPSLSFGDILEIDASNPGQLVKNNASSRPVLRCVRSNTFERI